MHLNAPAKINKTVISLVNQNLFQQTQKTDKVNDAITQTKAGKAVHLNILLSP